MKAEAQATEDRDDEADVQLVQDDPRLWSHGPERNPEMEWSGVRTH